MDTQVTNQTPSISDDQELAKALAGVSQAVDDNLQFEETGTVPGAAPLTPPATTAAADPATPAIIAPTEPAVMTQPMVDTATPGASTVDPLLDSIKQQALSELRPLVDKLNVGPEEKFDTYLLLLRSTDDKELIAPAHAAAAAITDEARRAQALLDIIKEIDFLSQR